MPEKLFQRISQYYEAHQNDLKPNKWRHYVSRMALWTGMEKYNHWLQEIKPQYLGEDDEAIRHRIENLAQPATINPEFHCLELRQPHFERYPMLLSYDRILFLTLFAQSLYGQDIRPIILERIPFSEFFSFYQTIYKDREAIRNLSTYVINYFYLSRALFPELASQAPFSLEYFWDISEQDYAGNSAEEICLRLYLLTHCIIGESHFYARKISDQVGFYQQMLTKCEELITEHFNTVSLDNKLEYLVCAKILGSPSPLEGAIFTEAERSLSDEGDFLIDRHNGQTGKNDTLDKSEHRNAMYLMAASEWALMAPHSHGRSEPSRLAPAQ